MAHKDDKKNSFYGASTNDPRPSKLGPKFSSVRALTDIALIAFEVEHERNRLQEELSRLEAAQDDTMRSLEILDFMAARMDDDPLVNASKNPLLSQTAHPSTSMNGDGGQNAITAASASSHTSLEYLPSSTMIRLANRQLKKLRDIAIGDRILSLCINSYPSVGAEKRDSLLPKMKRPSNAQAQFKRSASGLPSSRTVHALSHANISVPIMLPPPPVHPNESDEFQDDEMKDIHQRYHNQKENNSRASMPFISYHNANNMNHEHADAHSHNGTHNGHNGHSGHNGHMNGYAAKPRNTSPTNNLIRLSQTDLVKDSLAMDNHNHQNSDSPSSNNNNNLSAGAINKMRSKSVAQAHLKKSIGLPMVSPPPPMDGALTKSRSLHSSQHGHPRQRSTTSFPTGNYLSHTAYKHPHPQSRSTNSSPRFSTSAAQSHNSSNNSTAKKPRVSFQDSNVNGHSNSGGRKDNYLESVTVLQIVESKMYRLIEIITDNNFKIRCSPTHVFWICGKGWGCVDSKSRNLSETKSPKQKQFVHELKAGELLLSVAGKKYRISTINVLDKPKGIAVCALVVSKNDCFFANDLLVKHSMS